MGHKPFVQERPSYRPARFAQRVKEELAELVPAGLKDPRLENVSFLTITSVSITPDLKHATVLFSVFQPSEGEPVKIHEIEAALNQAAGFLRRELMHRIGSKITPQLVFKYDKGLENTGRIDELLKQIR